MIRGRRFCTAAWAMPSSAVNPPARSSIPASQPGGRPSSASVRHIP